MRAPAGRTRPVSRRRPVTAAVIAIAVAATACSQSKNVTYTSAEQPYVDALGKAMDAQAPGLGADDSRCIAGAFVRAIGVDRFRAKVKPDRIGADFDVASVSGASRSILTTAQAARFPGAAKACGSLQEAASLFSLQEAKGIDPVRAAETLRCVSKRLNDREAGVLAQYYLTRAPGTEELRAKTIATLTLKACGVATSP
ncbi:MAG: hypothetical protein HYX34_11615 [Actinobacteria bacterium]|nr:hypothetical protein [Actinomycetota bacterium]